MYKPGLSYSKVTTPREKEDSEKEESPILKQKQRASKIICLVINRLIVNKLADSFQRNRLLPLRQIRIQQRMKKAIEGIFRRQDYLAKWEAFQNIRRASLFSEKRDYQNLKAVLKKQRGTAVKLLLNFMVGKKRFLLNFMLGCIKQRGDIRQHQINNNFRKGLRSLSKIFSRKMNEALFRVKDSRVIMGQTSKLRNIFRIIKEIRIQNIRWAFALMRREMIRSRQEKAKEEIQELDQKLGAAEDEELTNLQNRHKQLSNQLEEVKKEREDIQGKLDQEIKEAEDKKTEMKDYLQELKTRQQQMKKKISEIQEELKTPFSLGEIYQLCYENLLWTISQSSDKTFNREELLKSLEVPLVPIDLPLDQLKEENKVLKDLISQYVVMYGEKKLPAGCKMELPYEYLLKQNNVLYKMLMALLPNARFLREELHGIREAYQNVQRMVKDLGQK